MTKQARALAAVVVFLFLVWIFWDDVGKLVDLDPQTKRAALKNGEVRVYNWSHYISESVLKEFTEQSGIDVVYDFYSSNEEMLARVADGSSGYDVAFPSDYMVAIMAKKGLLSPLDKGLLTNYRNLDPTILQKAVSVDGGNVFAVPYMWGTVGIGYNEKHFTQPPRTFGDLRKEELKGRISIIDDERFGLGAVLKSLGYSANTLHEHELNAAVDWLLEFKPYLLSVDSEKYLRDLERQEAWAAVGFSGDIMQTAKVVTGIKYAIPSDGAVLWIDSMVVLRESKNRANAHRFINHLLDASSGARIANEIRYASANLAARGAGMDEALLSDRAVFPRLDVLERSEVLRDLDDGNRLYAEKWLQFKQGQRRIPHP